MEILLATIGLAGRSEFNSSAKERSSSCDISWDKACSKSKSLPQEYASYYEVLGLLPRDPAKAHGRTMNTATRVAAREMVIRAVTAEQVTQAFRRVSPKHHPDKYPKEKFPEEHKIATANLQLLNDAKECLGDETKKR